MANTGILPPKIPRQTGVLPLAAPVADSASEVNDTGEQGAIPFYLLLLFTFFLLGRPQDFIKSMRLIQWAMFFGGAAILTWALGVFSRHIKFRKSPELTLMMGLSAWFLVSLPFCYLRFYSLENMKDAWIKILMIFIVLTQTVTSTKRLRLLLWVMFISGLLATGGTLAQGADLVADKDGRYLGISRGFFWGNYLGIAASVLTPYIVAMLLHTRSILKRAILVATFASMIIMLVLTASRSNIILILICLILVWTIVLRDSFKAKLIGLVFALGLMLSIAFAPHAFWERVGTLWGSEASVGSDSAEIAEASAQQRRDLLLLSIQVTFEKPVFGLGVGNFPIYSGNVSGVLKGTHNTFTQVSSETGIPGLILFLMLLTTGIIRMRRMVRRCKGRPELAQEKSLAAATIASILSFMVGACFAHIAWEYYLYYVSLIGAALQTIFTLRTGESLELPKLGRGKANGNGGSKKKGIGWHRLSPAEQEARA